MIARIMEHAKSMSHAITILIVKAGIALIIVAKKLHAVMELKIKQKQGLTAVVCAVNVQMAILAKLTMIAKVISAAMGLAMILNSALMEN